MDPISLAVIAGGLEQVADEMDEAFVATAFSPVIAEGRDRASGVYSPTGEVVAQGADGLPGFISVMQFTVQQVIRVHSLIRPGDVFLVNDPYDGGTHLMDVKAVKPIFVDGELVAFIANTGHWPDIGGNVPGGYSVHAREVYAEGLQIPPVRLVREGERDDDLLRLILRNIRIPSQRLGDIEAQLGALDLGEKQIHDLYDHWGKPQIHEAMQQLRIRSERQMRDAIQSIPDDEYVFEDYLDSDGIVNEPLTIRLCIRVTGEEMEFDFSGSSPPCEGPMNCVLPTTISACWIALKHTFPFIAINAGSFLPCTFTVPDSTFLCAKSPRPVSGCAAEVSQRIIDVVFGALGQALPDKIPAAAFSTVNNLALGGSDGNGRPYVVYMYGGGGYGGHRHGDGLTNGPSTVSNAPHPAIEIYEQRAPLLFHRFEIRQDSAGAGKHRGGFGVLREFELRGGTARVSFLGERGKFPPFGLAGGLPAAKTRIELVLANDERYIPEHITKDENIELSPGARVIVETPGGGGWGPPAERAINDVLADLTDRYITLDFATRCYPQQIAELVADGRLAAVQELEFPELELPAQGSI
jgi:N-methylhydantoinase B